MEALTSLESSDKRLSELGQQIESDRIEREKEQLDSQARYEKLSSRADLLQSFFNGLSERFTTFSGSEGEKYRIASEALDGIQKSAAALELENRLLKWSWIKKTPKAWSPT